MKLIFKIFLIFIFSLSSVFAETFNTALKRAYDTNPELNAERESLNISEQEYKVSMSSYLPTITLEGSKSQEDTEKLTNQNGSNASFSDVDPESRSITVTQTLIDFGRGAELAKSKIGIDLAKAKLLKKEQEILYKAAGAYTGLISAKEKFLINNTNVNLLERQVETDQNRLEKGEITLTDLAQSESSLSGAKASLMAAENELVTSKANYEKIIGKKSTEDIKEVEEINLIMLDKQNKNMKHMELLARSKAMTDQVIAEIVADHNRDKEILNYKIDKTNNFVKEKFEEF